MIVCAALALSTSLIAPVARRPEMVFLPTAWIPVKDPAKRLDPPMFNKVNGAILRSLRERASDKYLIGLNTSTTVRRAFNQSGLSKKGFSPLQIPDAPHSIQDAAAYGKALDAQYVAFLVVPEMDFPLLKGMGGGLGANHIPAEITVICFTVDVAKVKFLPAAVVKVKGTKDSKAVDLEKYLIGSKPTPDTLPDLLGTFLAEKLHAEMEKAPFKP